MMSMIVKVKGHNMAYTMTVTRASESSYWNHICGYSKLIMLVSSPMKPNIKVDKWSTCQTNVVDDQRLPGAQAVPDLPSTTRSARRQASTGLWGRGPGSRTCAARQPRGAATAV